MTTQIQKQIEEVLKEFDKLYVHKGEDGDDPEEEWAWTIRGGFPIEVKLFLESKLNTIASKSAEKKELDTKIDLIYVFHFTIEDLYGKEIADELMKRVNNNYKALLQKVREVVAEVSEIKNIYMDEYDPVRKISFGRHQFEDDGQVDWQQPFRSMCKCGKPQKDPIHSSEKTQPTTKEREE